MDGIFGVGLAEILIVGLVLFIIGGPENATKWARELGRWVRKARQAWAQMMAEMEAELGPEGKEVLDAARELGQGARQAASLSPQKRLLGETIRAVESAVSLDENLTSAETEQKAATSSTAPAVEPERPADPKKYAAWIPPEQET